MNEEERVWLSVVRRQVGSLRFETVRIVVHDAQIVQIERIEKFRLNEARVLAARSDLRPTEEI